MMEGIPFINSVVRGLGIAGGDQVAVVSLSGVGRVMSKTLYMLIKNFRNGDAVPVHRRFRNRLRVQKLVLLRLFVTCQSSELVRPITKLD